MCKYDAAIKEDAVRILLADRIKHHGLKHPVAVQDLPKSGPGVGVLSEHDMSMFPDGLYLFSTKSNDFCNYNWKMKHYLSDPVYSLVSIRNGKIYPLYSGEDDANRKKDFMITGLHL